MLSDFAMFRHVRQQFFRLGNLGMAMRSDRGMNEQSFVHSIDVVVTVTDQNMFHEISQIRLWPLVKKSQNDDENSKVWACFDRSTLISWMLRNSV